MRKITIMILFAAVLSFLFIGKVSAADMNTTTIPVVTFEPFPTTSVSFPAANATINIYVVISYQNIIWGQTFNHTEVYTRVIYLAGRNNYYGTLQIGNWSHVFWINKINVSSVETIGSYGKDVYIVTYIANGNIVNISYTIGGIYYTQLILNPVYDLLGFHVRIYNPEIETSYSYQYGWTALNMAYGFKLDNGQIYIDEFDIPNKTFYFTALAAPYVKTYRLDGTHLMVAVAPYGINSDSPVIEYAGILDNKIVVEPNKWYIVGVSDAYGWTIITTFIPADASLIRFTPISFVGINANNIIISGVFTSPDHIHIDFYGLDYAGSGQYNSSLVATLDINLYGYYNTTITLPQKFGKYVVSYHNRVITQTVLINPVENNYKSGVKKETGAFWLLIFLSAMVFVMGRSAPFVGGATLMLLSWLGLMPELLLYPGMILLGIGVAYVLIDALGGR